MKVPDFLTLTEVLEIHRDQIARYGGDDGMRDLSLLESAVAVPQASFEEEFLHPGLFDMAAAYAYHIAENQPFMDGNKRTALASALVFLVLNGVELSDPKGVLYQAMMDVAAHKVNKNQLVVLFRSLAQG